MTFVSVTDAWMAELTTNVVGLRTSDTPPVPVENRHPYASWSMELLATSATGRHVAVYPKGEAEGASPWTSSSPPGDQDLQRYTVLIWEDASGEGARLQDNDTANAAWLTLAESVKARFRIQANVQGPVALGASGSLQRYTGCSFDMRSSVRVIQIDFTVLQSGSFT